MLNQTAVLALAAMLQRTWYFAFVWGDTDQPVHPLMLRAIAAQVWADRAALLALAGLDELAVQKWEQEQADAMGRAQRAFGSTVAAPAA